MILQDYDLSNLNTFSVKAKSKYFAVFKSESELKKLVKNCIKPFLTLGGGSNILLTKNFDGTVLKNEIDQISIIKDKEESVIVKVGAGVPWHDFVLWAIEQNYGGVENMSLIPGSTGAAPMQNIGAYGVELESVFYSLEAVNIDTAETKTFHKKECDFGYRYSVFKGPLKGKYIITYVSFELQKKHTYNTSYGAIEEKLKSNNTPLSIRSISNAIIEIRQAKLPDPKIIGNSGSFFKNPVIDNSHFEKLKSKYPDIVGYSVSDNQTKVAAGWLIDRAGWKGYREGDAGVHKNQALVLVNYQNAKGKEILILSQKIQKSIKEKYDIDLEREVNVL